MISVVVPIYNEETNISALLERLRVSLDKTGEKYEVIYVNDGSKDRSMELIRELSAKHNFVKYINFSRNFGHQIAVSAGLDKCKGEQIVIIDADGQDPPELIPALFNKMKEGFEIVYAKRRSRNGETLLKKATAKWFYKFLSRITSIEIPLDTGDFRILHRKVAEQVKRMPEKQKFLRGQMAWVGFRQTFLEYDRDERMSGQTGYTFRKMLRLAMDGITSFSNLPLRIATISGFVCSFFGLFLIAYTLYSRFILKDYEPGWSSLMITIVFIGGIQLIGIGIIGEYISRIYDNIRNRPLYIIDETNIKDETEELPSK
ncbi:MAG: glycosyltransferase family 2 protein [Flavobacteriales bacterium]|nr:glycosyltransferase family 2 protein [Flavobacteriales bacterium]